MEPGTSSGSAIMEYHHEECINKKCPKDCKIIFQAVYPIVKFYRVKNINYRQHTFYVCKKCYFAAFTVFNSLGNNSLYSGTIGEEEIPEFPKYFLEYFTDVEEDHSEDETDNGNSLDDSSWARKHKKPVYQNPLFAAGAQRHWRLNLNGVTSDDSDSILGQPDTTDSELEMNFVTIRSTFPPAGLGQRCLAMWNGKWNKWLPCNITNIQNEETEDGRDSNLYVVHYVREFEEALLSGKHMAHMNVFDISLPKGTRILAKFKPDRRVALRRKNSKQMQLGIIVENRQLYNKDRFLVHFDNGMMLHVKPKNIRLLIDYSSEVWSDVAPSHRCFVKNLLTMNDMLGSWVNLRVGDRIFILRSERWCPVNVNDVDGSLVLVQFLNEYRFEWIYRRASVMGWTKDNICTTQGTNHRFVMAPAIKPNFFQLQEEVIPRGQFKKMPADGIEEIYQGAIVYYQPRVKYLNLPMVETRHNCTPLCLIPEVSIGSLYNPLTKPMLSGWSRLHNNTGTDIRMMYKTPCGMDINNVNDLRLYLLHTQSTYSIENFTFHPDTQCLSEYIAENVKYSEFDLTDGYELLPISVVNSYDDSKPPTWKYYSKSKPAANVEPKNNTLHLCLCIDDCSDITKCGCHQLTLREASSIDSNCTTGSVGYSHKKLFEEVPTGIFECNRMCRCYQNKCINRIVQQPTKQRLQVFKTHNRGWGLRTLVDIPLGTFVCSFTGDIVQESVARNRNQSNGTDYFIKLELPKQQDGIGKQKAAIDEPSTSSRIYPELIFPMELSDEEEKESYVIDATVSGNVGRFINHSCSPNLLQQFVFITTHDRKLPHVGFFTKKHITAGEELTRDYKLSKNRNELNYGFTCACGTDDCIDSM